MNAIDVLLVSALTAGCSSSNAGVASSALGEGGTDAPSSLGASAGDGEAGAQAPAEDFSAAESDFDCSRNSEWTAVGFAHYKNVLGHAAQMLDVARSADGGVFPVGTIVQLNPAEAMVKRGQAFDATGGHWEFFTLVDSDAGTTAIKARGGGASVSNGRGTCLGCHSVAAPQWDLICGDNLDGGAATAHGCALLSVPNATLAAIHDIRCQ